MTNVKKKKEKRWERKETKSCFVTLEALSDEQGGRKESWNRFCKYFSVMGLNQL